jgi:osmotically-inducible protein OsmY
MRTPFAPLAILPLLLAGCMDDAKTNSTTTSGGPTPSTAPATTGTHNETTIASQDGDAKKPDNSGRNADDSKAALTAVDQSNDPKDIAITTKVRQAVVAEKDLSTNAKNVKIITRDGVVTLRGPVENVDERTRIGRIAGSLPEVQKVDNQTEAVH